MLNLRRPTSRRLALPFASAIAALILATSSVSAAAGWTGPKLVGPAGQCFNASAVIDSAGRYHVAAECTSKAPSVGLGSSVIRYSVSNADGSWTTTNFVQPPNQEDREPQLAIDGQTLWIAYSRNNPATCGFSWAGVYYRKRTLPNGSWSVPKLLGRAGDHLQSFRVVNGRIYATIDSNDSVYYETYANGLYQQFQITDAVGLSSLRVGSDGQARIVYEAATSLRYARFTGDGFVKSTIPGTTKDDRAPQIVLDASNSAHVIWTHSAGPACGDMEMSPVDGTYYATNRGGSWTPPAARLVSQDTGAKSLTVEVAGGRAHVVVAGDLGLWYYTKPAGGAWTSQKLSSAFASDTQIRQNQTTGSLFVAYVRGPDANVSSSVFDFTKP